VCALFDFYIITSVADVLKKQMKNKRDPIDKLRAGYSTSFVFCLQSSLNAVVGRPQIAHSAQDDGFRTFCTIARHPDLHRHIEVY
jgi:hypothetical protein